MVKKRTYYSLRSTMNFRFPALSDSSPLRYLTFVVLYFSQGIPEGITTYAIPAWLAMSGKTAQEIGGYSALVMIPFSLKIILAPIIERYTYLPMGKRRPWLLFGQFGILCSLLALSTVADPLQNMYVLSLVVFMVHVFIMFQDIATDSLVIDIVPVEQQGRANSFMWGSKTIGISIALFAGTWLINEKGFSFAISLMSVSVLLIMFVPLLLRERHGEKLLPWTNGATSPEAAKLTIDSWGKLFKSFVKVVLLKNSLILLLTVFTAMAAIHFMRTLLPIFTIQELGWTNMHYSEVYAFSNLTGGVVGMLLGALIIHRFGIVRLIQASLFTMIILSVTMYFSVTNWKNEIFINGFILVFCMVLTLIFIGVLALAMKLCWRRVSAMQFTFCMTIFNAGLSTGAALLGYLRTFLSWQHLFLVFGTMIVAAMLILRFIKTAKHHQHVDSLEQKYLEVLEMESSLLVKADTQ